MARDAHELAEALREKPPALDDVARARMEKSLLAASRTVRAPIAEPKRSGRPFAAGVGAGLAVAALAAVAWLGWTRVFSAPPGAPVTETSAVASFETFAGESPVRSGEFAEGEAVTTDAEQRVRAHFADRRVEVEVGPSSRTRFLRLDGNDLAVALDRGSVRVSFHPERRGERTLAIETPLARVEVVGTVFRVNVGSGGTRVSVEEGIVRVVPREGTERFVHAGESLEVPAPRAGSRAEHAELPDDETLGTSRGLDAAELAELDVPNAEVRRERLHLLAPHPVSTHSAGESTGDGESIRDDSVAGESGSGESSAAESIAAESSAAESSSAESSSAESSAAESSSGDSDRPVAEATSAEGTAEPTASRRRSGRALAEDLRFEVAMRYVDANRFEEARHELHAIVRTSGSRTHRARAWTDIALTYARENDIRQASEAYRRAAEVGRGTEAGANALFALGQMRLRLGEDELARAAFREYLEAAPAGSLADRARRTLCQRLGVWEECAE